jgi:hypothetical protein
LTTRRYIRTLSLAGKGPLKFLARPHGVLSCFDRMLFRGIMSGWAMAQFLDGFDVNGSSLKPFLLQNSERVKDHAIAMVRKYERPFQYLSSAIRKEDNARELAQDVRQIGTRSAGRIPKRQAPRSPGPAAGASPSTDAASWDFALSKGLPLPGGVFQNRRLEGI